jgi:hypothetical protein
MLMLLRIGVQRRFVTDVVDCSFLLLLQAYDDIKKRRDGAPKSGRVSIVITDIESYSGESPNHRSTDNLCMHTSWWVCSCARWPCRHSFIVW